MEPDSAGVVHPVYPAIPWVNPRERKEQMEEEADAPKYLGDPSTWGVLPTPSVVKDYEGKIDGEGIKSVMFSPKCPLELIPPHFTEGLAEVLKHGATKYAPNNWMRGMSWETVAGGMLRHLTAFRRGEEIDPESGQPHLFHLACGTMFLAWYAHGPKAEQYRRLDDRVFGAEAVKQTEMALE